jgi:hypothetical protein
VGISLVYDVFGDRVDARGAPGVASSFRRCRVAPINTSEALRSLEVPAGAEAQDVESVS